MYNRILTLLFALYTGHAIGQNCPVNMDFSSGTLTNWQCYTGATDEKLVKGLLTNVITLIPSAPVKNVHTLIQSGTEVDKYGKFSITPPNGSKYSVKLGNNGAGKQAEAISYTLDIPKDQQDFALTYAYAVVLQTSSHWSMQQARFLAKVYNLTDKTYIDCAGAEYVTTASLPGFQKSAAYPDVVFKPWSSVTLNLSAYRGKKLRIEFTTAACTQGGHFGYAYIAISQACTGLITGTEYCSTATNVTLNGPSGYAAYKWYNADRSKLLGTASTLALNSAPADGTVVNLDLKPFPGFGCPNTVTATLRNHAIGLNVNNPAPVCWPAKVDITTSSVVNASGRGLQLSYWADAAATKPLENPKAVALSGTYYVKAINTFGCSLIKPVVVIINPLPNLLVANPPAACSGTIDITSTDVTKGSSGYSELTYWLDTLSTQLLANPKAVAISGTYYIKAQNALGCAAIKPVQVTIHPLPYFTVSNPPAVCFPTTVNLAKAVNLQTTAQLQLSYWTDAAATQPLNSPGAVAVTGTYYVKAHNQWGCSVIKAVPVIVNPLPELRIADPKPVCAGNSIDLTAAAVTANSTGFSSLTYWTDADATKPLAAPQAVSVAGTYYVKAATASGCAIVKPVNVSFYALPELTVIDPPAVCYPATVNLMDAVNAHFGDNVHLTYWKDPTATLGLGNYTEVAVSGTYYIKATSAYGCETVKPVKVWVNALPQLVVNNPPDICYPGRVDLSAAAVTTGSKDIKTLTYWKDGATTIPLANFRSVADGGVYYIKAVNLSGCSVVQSVLVSIHQLPAVKVNQPKAIYQPKTIDLTKTIDQAKTSANAILTYWTDAALRTPVTSPKAVGQSGTYYVKASNAYGCYTVAAIEVFLAPVPDILVPTAFTPMQATNKTLYPFLKGIRSFKFFRLYNRWGNIVYETNEASADKGWDGNFKGAIALLDTFTWVSEGIDYLGNTVHRSGNTVLLK